MMRWPSFLQQKSAKKVGIIAHDRLGHALFASVLARNIQQQTSHEVYGVVKMEDLSIIPREHFELIYPVQFELMEILPYFLAERLDVLINLSTDPAFEKLQNSLEVPVVIDQNWHLRKGFFSLFAKAAATSEHLLDHLLNGLRGHGVTNDQLGLELNLKSSAQLNLMEIFDPFIYAMMYHGGFVLFFIENDAHYSIEQIMAVCQKINQPVLLIGKSSTNSIAATVAAECGPNIIDATVLSKMQYLPSLIEQCKKIYTFDNDLSQILGAFSKPVTLIRNSQAVDLSRSLYFPMDKRHLLTIRTIAALS